jgi:membrane protein DedA with SNARE-associated domain
MSAFLIAAGALGVSRRRFLVAFGTARVVRYGLVAWLALAYGRHVVRFWSGNLQKWSAPVLWVFGGMLVSGIGYGIWRIRRQRSQQRQIDLAVGQPRSV